MSKSFDELFCKLLELKHWNESTFCERTELGKMMFRHLKKPNHRPLLRTVMTICVAMELDASVAKELLESAGYCFSKTYRVHAAYCFILEHCKGYDLEACNQILKEFEIRENDYLGPHPRT